MNNVVESIKIEVSRQSETILGVDLMGLYPWTPLKVFTVCSQVFCCLPWITHYVNDPRKSNYTHTTTQIQIIFHIFFDFLKIFLWADICDSNISVIVAVLSGSKPLSWQNFVMYAIT